jgi:hypothetical protein
MARLGKIAEELSGDRPIDSPDADQLGLASMAVRLAKSISEQASARGLVIGMEGKWGSGKSSLLNLTLAHLRQLKGAERPEIIEFRPWLLGTRDALLDGLFSDLAGVIEASEAKKTTTTKAATAGAKKLANDMRGFAAGLGKYSSLASLAGLVVPGAGIFAEALSKVAQAGNDLKSGPSLSEMKDKLSSSLGGLGRKIVVSIDDVDRLEPMEVIELLRLVKSVADFPNITYLLCYDIDVLSDNIKTALGIHSGTAYLEKIVQFSVHVPTPEVFDLRHWFSRALLPLLPALSNETRKRLEAVVDIQGGRYLQTPRSVVRALNSLRVTVPAIGDVVDIPDLVWLELIKLGNPGLYRWIENYCASMAVTSLGRASVREETKIAELRSLHRLLELDHVPFKEVIWELEEHLPGIKAVFEETGAGAIFGDYPTKDRERAIAGRRLASPDHYRNYFALSIPKNAITSADYESFWSAADTSVDAVSRLIVSWLSLLQTNSASKAEVFLDRLYALPIEQFSERRAKNTALALSNILDNVAKTAGIAPLGGPVLWFQGEKILAIAIERSTKTQRMPLIRQIFRDGAAISWLSDVYRDQLFAYGRAGDTARGGAIIFEAELDAVTKLMLVRYKSMTMADFLATPRPTTSLYGWLQSGDPTGLRTLVEGSTKGHEGLITFLEKLTGSILSSSDGRVRTLSRSNVSSFLDFDTARKRLLEATKSSDRRLALRAKAVLQAMADGERY